MNERTLLERIHDIGAMAWLRFVQALNWIMVSVAGALLLVHQAYPQVIAGAIGKMPPALGIPLIFAFALLVHYALRRAKKDV